MTSLLTSSSARTLADLLRSLGGIVPDRVLMDPPPGRAVEADVEAVLRREHRLCELVDGTLVEKAIGYRESVLALAIASALREFVIPRNLGLVSGESGMMRLFAGLVRMPDVAYVSWGRVPGRRGSVRAGAKFCAGPGRRGIERGQYGCRDGPQTTGVF